ncbi:type II toxin-antitoxin system HigB family toxin [Legionella anisa]|uniref:Cytoplasmic protein n=1 Tax=Legionella anisa TaxID=28082 RepID=A0AAX0WYV9_9GAMM|nr:MULTISPECIES: type II toxin-antitoxin system HigB family toxin [Legionella]HAT9164317.1 cytoplasmic protein [Legionella pneumophila subsp. pneumophila]AOU90851.1 cytoplasmic protein [Legionella pneumophila]AWN76031.1 cytoplasmic protein [Legionella anisa]MCW8426882.1 type II toxin-antitoxin system HigB family toxin [Legionella anisa]MCW8449577.1 type II toxin-antitoxin system HigB family toxin [Legionella anisa]
MHVISKKPFVEAAKKYPNQRQAILDLYRVLDKITVNTPLEMKAIFPSLDNFKYKDKWWIIDIGGNHLRLMAFIQFSQNRIYVKHIVTHAEYDRLCEQYRRNKQ